MQIKKSYRNAKPLKPGNIAHSATLHTYPAWSWGLKRYVDDTTLGPGPASKPEGVECPCGKRTYKFGHPPSPVFLERGPPYYKYDLPGPNSTGGWRPIKEKKADISPGPADYAGRPVPKPFNVGPTWGPPPKQVQEERVYLMPMIEPPRKIQPRSVPPPASKYPLPPKPSPGPADYNVTKPCKCCDVYKGVTMKQRYPPKAPNGFPSSAQYFVHQSTLGAATRREFKECCVNSSPLDRCAVCGGHQLPATWFQQ
uniref:Uncharacterized protein n=1 Tax=Tetraselmis sp. GSL018 TaxID=582737 RepID=A0A061SG37_9CHLO|mmetsp:Transcript_12626/g.29977  ORF Transcript_12626/g.29977 Transcript_12626/m.29977 type:complete len:254 (-) Transcript_12626:260-1021(-)|eukprot:CAMPEP_0177590424 /NCGR_PEP_ID=MMETSP0419_2-20121207/7397_1 /TAXON_ID=582737 /ORGANISM="Tetraselmis sp., Strain GSL018" /LENGTH=253 /DNA_ID=CAMNT_0019080979 /DNA_START=169 /DNA_END=930 /DNA_ORIENTATION=-